MRLSPPRLDSDFGPSARRLQEEKPMRSPILRRDGFALAELMIVIAILGLLAAVALPQYGSATRRRQCEAMQRTLAEMRAAIDKYWAQHDGFPGPTAQDLERQLTEATDRSGGAGELGPYVFGGALPANPVTGKAEVQVVGAMPAAPRGEAGWLYCPATGELRSDATGCNPDGVAWFDF
jgi:general secretion pathway protein G